MKYLSLALIVVTLISCTSTKPGKQNLSNPLIYKSKLHNIEMSGVINSTLPAAAQSAEFKIQMSDRDSGAVFIYGPFKMLLARLYSTPKYFLFYNAITYEAFEGNPTASNLSRVMNLPLSYDDFGAFIRGEVPAPPETFSQDLSYNKDGKVLFVSNSNNYSDFALVDTETGNLFQLQRKNESGKMIFNVVYSSYKDFDGINLAQKIIFNFPDLNGSITVNADNITINQPFDKPFSFNLPGKLKINKLN
jgi:hypothetical protein